MDDKLVEMRMKSRIAEVILKHGRRMSSEMTQEIAEACVEVWAELNADLPPGEIPLGFPYDINVEHIGDTHTLSVTLSLGDHPLSFDETDLDSV